MNSTNVPLLESSIASPSLHLIGKESICDLGDLESDVVHTYESNTENFPCSEQSDFDKVDLALQELRDHFMSVHTPSRAAIEEEHESTCVLTPYSYDDDSSIMYDIDVVLWEEDCSTHYPDNNALIEFDVDLDSKHECVKKMS